MDSVSDTRPSPTLRRASQLFVIEERGGESPYIERVWRSRSVPSPSFISVAEPRWEIVVTRQRGTVEAVVRGPETRASIVAIPEDAEFVGVQFRQGCFMPGTRLTSLVDGLLVLPQTTETLFRLDGGSWDYPDFENAEFFVRRLVRERLLVQDPVVEAALTGRLDGYSLRSIQRRVLRATGLSHRALRQIERARRAVDLLESGVPILETAVRAGYADQPHLTRSLRRFIGQTPSQIAKAATVR